MTVVRAPGHISAILRNLSEIQYVVLHHSATASGNADVFREYHKSLGWSDIGYHFVICNGQGGEDGEVQPGRPVTMVGAHAIGYNHNSLGICLVGDFTKTKPTKAQLESLRKMLRLKMREYNIAAECILGHNEVAATACPGHLDVKAIRAEMSIPPTDYEYSPHREAIEKAIQLGLMAGYSTGQFAPDTPCTRAELAAVIVRLYEKLQG